MKTNNLKQWQPGVSGNPNGRPKGSRNIKKVVQDLLNSPSTVASMNLVIPSGTETPLEAIVYTLMVKAIRGDVRASDVLLKHAIDKDMLPVEGGFFNQSQLTIRVIGNDGAALPDDLQIDEKTGTLVV